MISNRRHMIKIVFLFLLTGSSLALAAPEINTLEKSGLFKYKQSPVAIRGYDTVAYFTEQKAVKGVDSYTMKWKGVIWNFSNQRHLELFRRNPGHYAPQFGGYCAYGVAEGYLAKIDGKQWSIIDSRLYLSYNRKFRDRWLKNPQEYIQRATGKMQKLLKS